MISRVVRYVRPRKVSLLKPRRYYFVPPMFPIIKIKGFAVSGYPQRFQPSESREEIGKDVVSAIDGAVHNPKSRLHISYDTHTHIALTDE